MKAQQLILLTGFILSSLFVSAQNNNTPKKGYYSIQKNAEKLNTNNKPVSNFVKPDTPAAVNSQRATKGFYSIGGKNETQNRTEGVTLIQNPDAATRKLVKPAVTKGYYSIGKNSEKLK